MTRDEDFSPCCHVTELPTTSSVVVGKQLGERASLHGHRASSSDELACNAMEDTLDLQLYL